MHVESSCRHEFLEAFGLSSDMLPGVVAYSPAKRRYAVFRGAFTAPAIKDFAITLRNTIPMSERPAVGIGCTSNADEPDIIGPLTDSIGEGDAEDMLAEIQKEERERAAALAGALRLEAESEQLRVADLARQKEREEEAKRKKKNKKKKKKKKKDQEL